MDGTLVRKDYVEHVWLEVIPVLYARENNIDVEKAKRYILDEYAKVGEYAVEWYDIKYWLRKFDLDCDWEDLLEDHIGILGFYPEVNDVIDRLGRNYELIIISNAAGEFIRVERKALNLDKKFDHIFSAVTDFGITKKNPEVYSSVCRILGVENDDIVHVGDSWEFDYISPSKAGIRAFYLDRDNSRDSTKEVVKNLKEFEGRIKSLKNK